MKYRSLGATELSVSEIGLGTWAFASHSYGTSTREDAYATIQAALDGGITLFDSAPLYGDAASDGLAEMILGEALGAQRQKVVIATKFGRNSSEGGQAVFTAQRARASVEASLRRLNTDWIDVLFFHSPFSSEEIADDVWEGLADLKREGKVRVIGHSISALPATQGLARRWASERQIDVIQVVYSLLNREAQALVSALAEQGIGVIAREVLANGFLSGAITAETVFPANHINQRYSRAELAERVAQVEQYRFLVRDAIRNLPQAAMRWVLDQPGISAVLSGAKTPAELADALAASAASPFSSAEQAQARVRHTKDYPAA